MDEISVEKWWNEICCRGKREKPREKPTQTSKPTWSDRDANSGPSGGRRAPNRLRHEAVPPGSFTLITCSLEHVREGRLEFDLSMFC